MRKAYINTDIPDGEFDAVRMDKYLSRPWFARELQEIRKRRRFVSIKRANLWSKMREFADNMPADMVTLTRVMEHNDHAVQ
jgi:hypothetical protein